MSSDILDACADGRLPPQVALMHLAASCTSAEAFAQAIAAARRRGGERLDALCALAARHSACWRLTRDLLKTVDHGGSPSIDALAAMFDAAVDISPAASVALYSLGDEAELSRATQEIMGYMRRARLIGADTDVLDLGCGIGRLTAALAARVRRVTGFDISPKMIEEARRRCAGLGNVSLAVSSGRDLAGLEDASMDLILAADVFPYLVQIDLALAQRHLDEAARVLRPGGALLIFNFSYRGDPERDGEELRAMARPSLACAPAPRTHFKHWDAAPFLLRKVA